MAYLDEALAAVRDIGPGGHYLGHPHTQENFQQAFFMPKLFDNNSYEQWVAEGSKDAPTRALETARKLLGLNSRLTRRSMKNSTPISQGGKPKSPQWMHLIRMPEAAG